MNRRTILAASGGVLSTAVVGCTDFLSVEGRSDGFEIETVTEELSYPWGMAFLPDDGRLLVTERTGQLQLFDPEGGTVRELEGTPAVYAEGQGGLLDVASHPDFPDEPWLYLTYSTANDEGESTTAVGRGRLDDEAGRLEDVEELYAAEPFVKSDDHYGSRVVFGDDGAVYVTVGDRAFKDFGPDHVSQDTTTDLGTTLRLEPDGSIPEDNPFVDGDSETLRADGEAVDDARDAIFSYGHRNAQGMTVHPETGELWQGEHGEEDGDELNVVEAGANYGWPVAGYGCEYGTDDPIGDESHEREDVVDPVYYWECNSGGFPPAGMTFYDGDAFPEWKGDLFIGNLAGAYLGRFTVDRTEVEEADPLLTDRGWRVRDVAVEPETGALYVAVDDENGPLVRLIPE